MTAQKSAADLTLAALQAIHDISSPIAVIDIIQADIREIPEDSRKILKCALNQIRDISNSFARQAKQVLFSQKEKQSPSLKNLFSIIEQITKEKNIEYQNRAHIVFSADIYAQQIFLSINSLELHRVLSNLINNAVEAIINNNRIEISLSQLQNEVLIQIQDAGKGIPRNMLNKLGQPGATFNKQHGTGLGLYHAMNTCREWGGRMEIQSQLNKGTCVKLFLPCLINHPATLL